MITRKLTRLAALLAVAAPIGNLPAATVHAQEKTYDFNIPAQGLGAALRKFGQTTSQQIIFSEDVVSGKRSGAIVGKLSADQALGKMLKGTGLHIRRTASGMYTLGNESVSQNDIGGGASESGTAASDIVVTGSRIRQSKAATSAPVTTFGEEELTERGYTQVGQMLNDITSNTPSFPIAPFQGFPGGSGQTFPNLFNLGAGRTLTLVNGRRFVTSTSGLGDRVVDTNIIPAGLIERVDIVQGGGAAIYGSDAIAGVVNYVLKTDFEGIEIDLQNTISSRGDDWRPFARVTAGKNFADGRGNIAIDLEYAKTQALYEKDRPLTGSGLRNVPNPANTSTTDGIPPTMYVFDGHLWAQTPSGVIFGATANTPASLLRSSTGQAFQFSPDGTQVIPYDTGIIQGTSSTAIGGQGRDWRTLSTLAAGVERYAATLNGHFDFTDSVRMIGEFVYGRQKGTDPYGTQGITRSISGQGAGGVITFNRNNPYLTPQAIATLSSLSPSFASGGNLYLSRFLDILPTRNRSNKTDTWRGLVGFEGDFTMAERELYWSVTASRGHTKGRTSVFDPYSAHILTALNATRNGAGQIVCSINADAITTNDDPSCIPINPFGSTTFTPDQAAYLYVKSGSDYKNTQDDFLATLGGDTVRLPGGMVKFAAAYEHRRESVKFTPFAANQAGLPFGGPPSPVRSGKYNTDEISGELLIPLIGEDFTLPFVKYLEATGSVRFVDHSIAGKNTVWGAGLRWDTGYGLILRGSRSQNFRAPTLDQQFAPTSTSNLPLGTDPCDADRINDGPAPATRLANCQALFAANPGYGPLATFQDPAENTGLMTVTTGGNPDLKNEISNTLTYGFVFQPTFVPRLTFSVDRIEIDLKDGLSAFTPANFLQVCYDTTPQPADFCSTFTRNALGYVVTGRQTTFNAGSVKYRGEVYSFNYTLPLGASLGSLNLGVEATHTSLLLTSVTGFDRSRTDGTQSAPDWRGRFDARYSNGPFRLFYSLYYLPSVKTSYFATIETTPVPKLASNYRHTISAQYELENFTIRGGINNFTDRTQSFPNRAYGDVFGRQFFLGVNVRL